MMTDNIVYDNPFDTSHLQVTPHKKLNINYYELMKDVIYTVIDLNYCKNEEQRKNELMRTILMLNFMDGNSCIKFINNKYSFVIKPENINKDDISYYVDTEIEHRNSDLYGDILTDMKLSINQSESNNSDHSDHSDFLGTIKIYGPTSEFNFDTIKELIFNRLYYATANIRIRFNTPFTEHKNFSFSYSNINLNNKLRHIVENNKIFTDTLCYYDSYIYNINPMFIL